MQSMLFKNANIFLFIFLTFWKFFGNSNTFLKLFDLLILSREGLYCATIWNPIQISTCDMLDTFPYIRWNSNGRIDSPYTQIIGRIHFWVLVRKTCIGFVNYTKQWQLGYVRCNSMNYQSKLFDHHGIFFVQLSTHCILLSSIC